jgi:hypothetical protein
MFLALSLFDVGLALFIQCFHLPVHGPDHIAILRPLSLTVSLSKMTD